MPKRLAILICVSATVVLAGIATLLPGASPVPPQMTLVTPPFKLPEHFKALTVRAEVSKEFEGRFTLGTKVDVLLIPHGKMPDGQAERVLSGVFVLPTSMVHTLNEDTGEVVESRVGITLALTDEQIGPLIAAEERGTLRIVPVK
jgi:Flp pilus assembly protein CpaB